MSAKHMLCSVASGLIIAGAVSTAQAAWVAPSGGWQLNYEASSGLTPDVASPAWTTTYQTSAPGTDNYMGIVTDSESGEQTLELRNTATSGGDIWPWTHLDSGAGVGTASDKITVDFRFRLVGSQADPKWGIGIRRPSSISGKYNDYLLNFSTNFVQNGNTFAYQGTGIGETWHDARLHIDVAANTANLYLDGDTVATYSITGTQAPGALNQVWFGDGQGNVQGVAEVSYLRITNNELASLVPEPASMGLLFMGGSSLLLSRRRQRRVV